MTEHSDSMFCLIPPKDKGNHHLVEINNGKFVPSDADCTKDNDEKVICNEKDCWNWLDDKLNDMYRDAVRADRRAV